MGVIRTLSSALLVIALVAGCSYLTPEPDDPGEQVGGPPETAEAVVTTWLSQVISGKDDLGWSMIYPNTRRDLFVTEAAYRVAVEKSDWSGVSFRVNNIAVTDGEYRVHVELRIKDGGAPPPFLAEWGVLQTTEPSTAGRVVGFITVRLGVDGEPSGIQATG